MGLDIQDSIGGECKQQEQERGDGILYGKQVGEQRGGPGGEGTRNGANETNEDRIYGGNMLSLYLNWRFY